MALGSCETLIARCVWVNTLTSQNARCLSLPQKFCATMSSWAPSSQQSYAQTAPHLQTVSLAQFLAGPIHQVHGGVTNLTVTDRRKSAS